VLVLIPLVIGVCWTYGFAAEYFGTLNLLTAFVMVILLGVGIDHGVHLLGQFEHRWNRESSTIESEIRAIYQTTGWAIYVSAIATLVGFAALAISYFKGFQEFGILSAVGIFLIALAYIVAFPPLLALFLAFGWKPKRTAFGGKKSALYQKIFQKPGRVLLVCALLSLALLLFVPKIKFDYDSRSLAGRSEAYELDAAIDHLLGHSQAPVVILADSIAEEKSIVKTIKDKKEKNGPQSSINFVFSLSDLVPENQEEKYPLIQKLTELLQGINLNKLPEDERDIISEFMRGEVSKPFQLGDLPVEVTRGFRNKAGTLTDRTTFHGS
jgi:predicted RND superfamily exporter protein